MENSNPKVIQVENVSKSFGEHKVLENITLHVCHNEIVSILGVSGSGKSTLFNIISGLSEPDSGSVTGNSAIGYMLQKDLLMPWKTVEDNIALPLILKGISKSEARATVGKYLDQFGLMGTQKNYPNSLSGGMRQRAALLRTYLISGELLLLDEPFSSVDAITRHQLHIWLLSIFKKMNLTILLITHDIEEALLLSDRIYLMTGNPSEVRDEIVLTPKGKTCGDSDTITGKADARINILEILENEINTADESGMK